MQINIQVRQNSVNICLISLIGQAGFSVRRLAVSTKINANQSEFTCKLSDHAIEVCQVA